MGSFGSADDYVPTKCTTIYDLSIREIEVILQKLEADNINLRRDLLEASVRQNDKDEEILKLKRDLLLQKKANLSISRWILALPEEYKLVVPEHVEESSTSPANVTAPKVPATVNKDVTKCSEDEEQHVKDPLRVQYRHLRLQLRTNNMSSYYEDDHKECSFKTEDANSMETASE